MLLVKLRTAEGQDFRVVTDRVLEFSFQDRERGADRCKITVDNSDLLNFDDPLWKKGAKLVVQWGYPGRMTPARSVVITSVKGFKRLSIEANAESVLMNRIPKTRVFRHLTISQIVTQIAAEYGWTGTQVTIDDTTDVRDTISQARLTDAQFLRRWASRLGFEFYIDHDGFHFHARRLEQAPHRTFRWFDDPGAGDILDEPMIENDITARPGRIRARGRDPLRREDIDEAADNSSDSNRDVLAPIMEILDPEDGSTTAPQATVASEAVVPVAGSTATEARTRARARFRRVQQVAVKMSLPVVGDPLLFSKSIVKLEGMGRRLSVLYWVTEVNHKLGSDGYVCTLKLVSDGHGGHDTSSNAAHGMDLMEATRPQPAASGNQNNQDSPNAGEREDNEPLHEVLNPEDGTSTFHP